MQPWSILRPLTCACVLTGLVHVTTMNGAFGDPLPGNAISVSSQSYPTAANTNFNAAPVHVEFLVNGKPIRGQGPGQCKHEPNGSIYRAPVALWTVKSAIRKAVRSSTSLSPCGNRKARAPVRCLLC